MSSPSSRTIRIQTLLSTVLILLTIGLYWSIYPTWHPHLPQFASAAAPQPQHDSLFLLHPEDHVHRAPKILYYNFNVTSGKRAPDGVAKEVFLINGQFPGPTIEARSGDELMIEVMNSLEHDDGISIHYHGLSMRGANEMDGTTGLTQNAIRKAKNFTYKFKIEESQSGTFWYHAHSDVQRADGLYGALIVHKPAVAGISEMILHDYDQEQVLLIGDWYHRPAKAILEYYQDYTNFGVEPAPDSLLINGRGFFDCSMAVPARPLDCNIISKPTLSLHGRRSRLRFINTGALTGFTLGLPGHASEVLTVDGGNAVARMPSFSALGIFYPGERVDIITEPSRNSSITTPMMTIILDKENLKFTNFALTPTQHFPISYTHYPNTTTPPHNTSIITPPTRYFNLAHALGPTYAPNTLPSTVDTTILLYTKIAILAEHGNSPKGFVNWTSWTSPPPGSPPLIAQDRSEWVGDPFVVGVSAEGKAEWVDVVLNNVDGDKGHPFHLHGHDFYILSTHASPPYHHSPYNPFNSAHPPAGGPPNTLNPLKKDSVYVPRMGYVWLRFRADNGGLWYFHCHVLWHEGVGMGMAIQVGGGGEGEGGKREEVGRGG